jgi:hypothetical protein
MNQAQKFSRRDILMMGGLGATLKWPFHQLPWWRPKQVAIAGAEFQIVRSNIKHHPSHRRYLLIHGDEQTAREILTKHMETHSGIAFLAENKTRTVPIESGQIDPNRMFSRRGAEASLKSLNPGWSQAQIDTALDLLDRERESFLNTVLPSDGELMVALHNNTQYSFDAEAPVSDQAARNQPDQTHAFFLCTDPADYRLLAKSPYNVVLQQYMRAPDDGSLSRRAAARRLRYVNLEVHQGDAARQQEMLDWLEKNLPQQA